jgi:hypothetical protein
MKLSSALKANTYKRFQMAKRAWNLLKRSGLKLSGPAGIANTSKGLNTMEAVSHVDLFQQLGLTKKYRIVWAELNREFSGIMEILENILSSHGVIFRVFANVEEARHWLLLGCDD